MFAAKFREVIQNLKIIRTISERLKDFDTDVCGEFIELLSRLERQGRF